MDRDRADTSPERVGNLPQTSSHTRHAVGIVSFEPNDDFAMGAPPGAPGAINGPAPTTAPADLEMRPRPGQPDVTPRAVTTDLPTIILVTTGHTGGKGSITQWVHAEYMEGSETIRPAFTQWVRGGYFSKVPTKVPTG